MKSFAMIIATMTAASALAAQAVPLGRAGVLRTFSTYEALNAEFVASLNSGKSVGGKSYETLRREVEAYSEGPFGRALSEAKTLICANDDKQLFDALLKVAAATDNSASEALSEAIVEVVACRPNTAIEAITRLPPATAANVAEETLAKVQASAQFKRLSKADQAALVSGLKAFN